MIRSANSELVTINIAIRLCSATFKTLKLFIRLYLISFHSSCICYSVDCLPGQYVRQDIVDEVMHTHMLSGTLTEKLEGLHVLAIIMRKILQ